MTTGRAARRARLRRHGLSRVKTPVRHYCNNKTFNAVGHESILFHVRVSSSSFLTKMAQSEYYSYQLLLSCVICSDDHNIIKNETGLAWNRMALATSAKNTSKFSVSHVLSITPTFNIVQQHDHA